MSRVDFYILPDNSSTDRFACTIAAKAWSTGNRVHIHTQSDEMANVIDDLLWIYRDISFIPHEIFNGSTSDETPVTIGSGSNHPEQAQVIINLDQDIPAFASSFERIVEIVGGSETNKQLARQRYRQYLEGDYDIHDHKIETINENG